MDSVVKFSAVASCAWLRMLPMHAWVSSANPQRVAYSVDQLITSNGFGTTL
jgi:hypothetical protein